MTGERKPGTFVKGDPRINRKGRPKSFDALRDLAQEISHEEASTKGQEIIIADKVIIEKGEPIIIKGHKVTVAEMILRSWAQSKNPQLQRAFMEIAFGKVPDVTQVSGPDNGPIEFIEIVRNATNDPNANNKE